MEKATFEDLKVNTTKKITSDSRRVIARAIEDEYQNQTTKLEAGKAKAVADVFEKYKKEKGVPKIMKRLEKATAIMNSIKNELSVLGVDQDGSLAYEYHRPQELKLLIEAAENPYSQPRTDKNKILVRLSLCETQGEALVIVQNVMGNGLIPSVAKKDLPNPDALQIAER